LENNVDISVKITKENKDGSADAVVRFDKEGLECLVQWGIVAMLTKALDEYKVRPEKDEPPVFPFEKAKSKKQVKK
jgi:hypothetical protein